MKTYTILPGEEPTEGVEIKEYNFKGRAFQGIDLGFYKKSAQNNTLTAKYFSVMIEKDSVPADRMVNCMNMKYSEGKPSRGVMAAPDSNTSAFIYFKFFKTGRLTDIKSKLVTGNDGRERLSAKFHQGDLIEGCCYKKPKVTEVQLTNHPEPIVSNPTILVLHDGESVTYRYYSFTDKARYEAIVTNESGIIHISYKLSDNRVGERSNRGIRTNKFRSDSVMATAWNNAMRQERSQYNSNQEDDGWNLIRERKSRNSKHTERNYNV